MANRINEWIDCKSKVTGDRINYIEQKTGYKLPESYIESIRNCDGGTPVKSDFKYFDINSQETWGSGIGCFLCLNESAYSNFLNIFLRPPEDFPNGLIAFAENGGGDYICFDYREDQDNQDPPIVYWNHEADIGKDISFVARNFEEFLGMLKEPEE